MYEVRVQCGAQAALGNLDLETANRQKLAIVWLAKHGMFESGLQSRLSVCKLRQSPGSQCFHAPRGIHPEAKP